MNTFLGIATVLAVLALGVRLGGRQHRLLHLLQLEHYESARLMLWLRRRNELFAPRELAPIAVLYAAAIALAAIGGSGSGWVCGGLLLLTTPLAALGVGDWRRAAVKPLVFTDRAQRLLVAALLPSLLLLLIAISLAGAGLTLAGLIVVLVAAFALLAFAPWTLQAANLALRPVQNAINRHYERQARHLLADWKPLIVGITGSYGKTTTKFCVGSVLSADRPTLVTPDSYNSFLGVIRTINERLEWRHRAFVVEMGMFRRGDIAELCELVQPKIGLITAIGPMHLERLGSIEQIAAAKGELLDALPPDGHFVTNDVVRDR
jgi:UDP-N-acetylmuramoyl-tripeptide--D-alanyl-D-alanine ligase